MSSQYHPGSANSCKNYAEGRVEGLERQAPVLSFVLPCLNEARSLSAVVSSCHSGGQAALVPYEIIVADNGSSDESREIAEHLGCHVLKVDQRGYGAALQSGIQAARGMFVLMGDADGTYDFADAPSFLFPLQSGADLVMGNRFMGTIQPGAMPLLHRWLGNPVLSGLGRLFFGISVGDFHCGLRGFRRDSILKLTLMSPGMEFASEMVIKASLSDLRIAEVPTTLRCDHPERRPHLRTWRDGWRHLRFMLSFSPKYSFLPMALVLLLLALVSFVFFYLRLDPMSGPNTLIFSSFSFLASLSLFSDYLTTRILFADSYGRPTGLGSWLCRKLLQSASGIDRLYQLTLVSLLAGFSLALMVLTGAFQGGASERQSNLLMYAAALMISFALHSYLTAAKISTIRSMNLRLRR